MAVKKISLSKGFVTIVDEEDYEWLNQWKWSFSKAGYSFRSHYLGKIGGKYRAKGILMHRIILKTPDNMYSDHINGDKLDNRRCNLRICDQSFNMKNMNRHKDNSSKYKGVCWSKKEEKWKARICTDYNTINLGTFDNEHEAAQAYNEAAIKYHKEFARLNVVLEK